ncbi:hypothetical protein Pmar_PMAR010364 [Perkinsus marinus ATCC 50983]|uniref:Uncharacterized protein n=1 Tax=Perkinsus marinus (strain ATCC 50983 / TXsc) TaxID=423536 RepID=C5KEP5_PERM5|nr:hypothetical protein Pmar_PMAR010364 [Perkinsus marinus ATCC 50983]EER17048.1 hypothetical protein Pmar_PMAR010364 [Perkinsus marinus ATCC 50983]|eukprot:XP_002785252.1 hypothetical protein Pmar_PMAR010364 [Perkinsus marinus ATCC 50983]
MKEGGFGDSSGGLGEMIKVLFRGLSGGGGLPMQALLEQALRGFYGSFYGCCLRIDAEADKILM